MFNPFKKKEKDHHAFTPSSPRPEGERKKEVPKKPWGKQERSLVGGFLLLTIVLSILAFVWQGGIVSSLRNILLGSLTFEKTIVIEK